MLRWLKLFLYLLILVGFMFTFPQLMKKIEAYNQIIETSEKMEIDNSSLFYSEEIWTFKAETKLKEQLEKQGE